MSTLQIVLLGITGVFALASFVFMLMFIIDITIKPKEKVEEEAKSVFAVNTVNVINHAEEEIENADVNLMLARLDEETEDEESEDDVDLMLAKLEAETADEEINLKEEELKLYHTFEDLEKSEDQEESFEEVENVETEEIQEDVQNETEETKLEESIDEELEVLEEVESDEKVEEQSAETTEKTEEETTEEAIEDLAEISEDDDDEDETDDNEILEFSALTEDVAETGSGSSIDYSARLEKIIAGRDKIERDLAKIQKAILKYERTNRRKIRNQKMLDRRAGELTNLNLLMYSVTDIKNVDEDKKVKQEELTAHIAELKASIQDAEEYIESNKEKNNHNVKMAKFLIQEKARYNEEIAELQELINAGEDNK